MNKLCLQLITFIHILFILFVIVIPFTNNNYFLLLHAIIVPFVMLHWILNDNTCILTIIEKNMREQLYGVVPDKEECFTCQLIEPIYDFKNNYESMSTAIYLITIGLWFISVYKLYSKWQSGEITSLSDFFIC
jgi:hypothetical protein